MNDKDFLIWIHERLEHVHGDNKLCSHMHRLRSIIDNIDVDKKSPPITSNTIKDLKLK